MHLPSPLVLFGVLWIAFGLSWLVAALWRSRPARRLATPRAWLYRVLLLAGFLLLNHRASSLLHARGLWPVDRTGATVLALLTVPGFAFAWWARLSLGPLWSSAVTLKQDHRLIDTGPYRLVRHPIYTGILFACLVSAGAEATGVALAGFALLAAGFVVKARLEEGWLAEELGPEIYAGYRRRVPMLVPFWRAG